MPRIFRPCPLALLGFLLLPLGAMALPPRISFEPDAVVADGITPKGRVVWFSIARVVEQRSAAIVPRIELVTEDDGDGKVRYDLPDGVPVRSIWFAVDLATGEAGVAAPEEFGLEEGQISARAVSASFGRFELDRGFVYLVLVRPGVGAWRLRAGDGGAYDEDGEPDGTLRAPFAGLEGIGDDPLPPPLSLAPRDLLLVIDPNRMDFLRYQVGN